MGQLAPMLNDLQQKICSFSSNEENVEGDKLIDFELKGHSAVKKFLSQCLVFFCIGR